jgi:hypothetical protein
LCCSKAIFLLIRVDFSFLLVAILYEIAGAPVFEYKTRWVLSWWLVVNLGKHRVIVLALFQYSPSLRLLLLL